MNRLRGEAFERLEFVRKRSGAERQEHLAVRRHVMRHAPADPVRHRNEVGAVALGEMLGTEHTGHGQVDRLSGLPREQLERGPGKLDQVLRAVLTGEAKEHRPQAAAPLGRGCAAPRP